MEIERALELLKGLFDNAVKLEETEYAELFLMCARALSDADSLTELMKIEEKMLIEEFGEKWYSDHSTKVAVEAFKASINEMDDDSDFKKYAVEHMDEITGESFTDMRLP